jgi:hydrogenase nickel incorporation protein HypA/HybF
VTGVHELSITRNVVAIVSERAEGQRVTRVRLEIGRLSAVVPDSIRFCFDICAQGTPLEGAELEIIESAGQELLIKEMEVQECA